jgi:hypothetical protein
MSKERTILAAIRTQIQNVNGSGSYTFDLSGADQVVLGESFQPHRVPGCYVYFLNVSTAQTAGTTVLTRYDRTMTCQIEGWVAAENSTPGNAALEAVDLMDDIMRALEADRSLDNNVRDIEISASSLDGQELDRPGLGLCILQLIVRYTETAGA